MHMLSLYVIILLDAWTFGCSSCIYACM